LLGFGQHSAD